MRVVNLQCEYLCNPLGIDNVAPRLSWNCISDIQSDKQTAYRIILSDEFEVIWDTGKVISAVNAANYAGTSLQSNRHYTWKLCVWNKENLESPFSDEAFFDTGILNDEWTAQWICRKETGNSLPVFTKRFELHKKIKRATAFISAPGMFELNINSTKAGDCFFEPGETCYDKKVFYSSYNVTSLLQEGENTLLVYLGKGFYHNPPVENRFNRIPKVWGELVLLCQLEIELADGTKVIIGTDDTWLTTAGPLTESCWLGGEDYDARIERNLPYASWENAVVTTDLPFSRIESRKYPAIQITETFKPIEIVQLSNGDYTVDFGSNFAGVYSFTAKASFGQKVSFYPAENIHEDGSADPSSTLFGKNKIYDTYTFAGSETETYMPKFVYHGMRYLQISGMEVTKDMVCGYALCCANQTGGTLECSNHDINLMNKIIRRSISDNMYHVLTDCPHREKLGWLEVPHLLYNTIADHFNIAAYTGKIVADICDAQAANGSVPSIVPPFTTGLKEHALREGPDTTPNDPIWCGSIIMLPFYSYKRYEYRELLETTYAAMHAYMAYLSTLSNGYLIQGNSLNRDLGDWVSLEETSVSFAVSCMYFQLAHTMAEVSDILNISDNGMYYKTLAEHIKEAINRQFFNAQTAVYDTGSQTAHALALYLGIVPSDYADKVLANLIENIKEHTYHITTGEYGMRPLLNVLSEHGYRDVVYRMLLNNTPPSYKYFIDLGKTSLPETWTGDWSQNHCVLGHGGGWLYEYLGGIRNDGTGFNKIIIEPYFPSDMNWLSVHLETPNGTVSSCWKKDNDTITLTVDIPVNSTAKIILPSGNVSVNHVEPICINDKTVLQVASGTYEIVLNELS